MLKTRLFLTVATALALVTGASARLLAQGVTTGAVSGTVTVGGHKLKRGAITFVSTVGNKDAYPAEINDGEYTTPPIPVGLCRITITVPPARPAGGGDLGPTPTKKDKGPPTPHMKYRDTLTSGLEYTVVNGAVTWQQGKLTEAKAGKVLRG